MQRQHLTRVCAVTLRRELILLISLLVLSASAANAHAADLETIDATFPASVTASGIYADENADENLENPSISADGRYMTFASAAQNLGERGPAGVNEAYVKDLQSGEAKLVSRANGVGGEQANEPGEGSGVENVIVSGDGRYVIFTSDASNLASGLPATEEPEEHPRHVYRRDLQTGETVLVDRVNGPQGAILDERDPEAEGISQDGRHVLFRDHVEDLEDPQGEHATGLSTVYVRDMEAGTTTAVSRASGAAGELADEKSRADSISADGRYVAFQSAATNLVAGMEENTATQVYVRDLQSDTTTLVSAIAGEPGNQSSSDPILVGEGGCEVAFASAASNFYIYEEMSVASPQVYLTDLCATPVSLILVSRANGEAGAPAGEGNAVPPTPVGASADGRYVLFSALSELTGESSSASTHLYVRDLSTGATTLIDRAGGVAGALADGNPTGGAISANGCRVAFATEAGDLAEPPAPRERREIYVRQLAPCQPPVEEETHHEAGGETPALGSQSSGSSDSDAGSNRSAAGTSGGQPPNISKAIHCVVPAMRALDLRAVEEKLSANHCALGHIAYHYNAIAKGGLVEQSLHQGTIGPLDTKVSIWLSRGRHRARARPRR